MSASPAWVLDASALLALLNAESGADVVEEHLDAAAISAVNWCETYGKLRQAGVDGDALVTGFAEAGIGIWPFDAEDPDGFPPGLEPETIIREARDGR